VLFEIIPHPEAPNISLPEQAAKQRISARDTRAKHRDYRLDLWRVARCHAAISCQQAARHLSQDHRREEAPGLTSLRGGE
jgi:hypothetical protein